MRFLLALLLFISCSSPPQLQYTGTITKITTGGILLSSSLIIHLTTSDKDVIIRTDEGTSEEVKEKLIFATLNRVSVRIYYKPYEKWDLQRIITRVEYL